MNERQRDEVIRQYWNLNFNAVAQRTVGAGINHDILAGLRVSF